MIIAKKARDCMLDGAFPQLDQWIRSRSYICALQSKGQFTDAKGSQGTCSAFFSANSRTLLCENRRFSSLTIDVLMESLSYHINKLAQLLPQALPHAQ